jgi:hypothetical protein
MPDENEQINPLDFLPIGELISLAEAAEKSGFSIELLRAVAKKGRLKAKKVGRNWFTTMEAVAEYKDSRSFKNIPKKYRDRS